MGMDPNSGQPGSGYQGYTPQNFPPPTPPNETPSSAPYGAAPAAPFSGSSSFNFQDMMQRWQTVLRSPSVATFDAQQSGANWATLLISLVGLGVVNAVFGMIGGAIVQNSNVGGNIMLIVLTPIFFLIGVAILWVIAKLFKGQGEYLTYAWLLSLAYVPLSAASAVVGIIPVLGGLAAIAISLYMLYLAVLATSSAHKLSMGASVAVVLIPAAVLALLFLIVLIAFATLLVGLGLSLPR